MMHSKPNNDAADADDMKNDKSGMTGRIGRKMTLLLIALALVAGVVAAATYTPTAEIGDATELGGATTQTNVSVTGSGEDAVIEHSDGSHTGVYESQNVTVEHSSDREDIRVGLDDVAGGNVTIEALRFNSTSDAWEVSDSKVADSNITHTLDISGNDTVKYRLKASFEAAATGNLTEWSIGSQDTTSVLYAQATDDETAFGNAALTDGAALKTGSDSVGETARIEFDPDNYSSYTGPAYVEADASDREVAAVELSNVSTDVTIGAEYQNSDSEWVEATNITVSESGTHGINISEWDQSKWRVTLVNDPGGHAALTREGIGSSSDELLGGGGGGSGGSIGDWWDGLNPGTQGVILVVGVLAVLIGYQRREG